MLHKIALLLVIVGAANLGLGAVVHADLIVALFGSLSHVVNVLIGLSGIYLLLADYTTLLKHA